MLEVDGCKALTFFCEDKQYSRSKVGDAGDFYEGDDLDARCTDCGAKHSHHHHLGCDCERCPVCYGQLISCDCALEYNQ